MHFNALFQFILSYEAHQSGRLIKW